MKKSFTENKSFLKISSLNRRNDWLVKEFDSKKIICKFTDENPLNLLELKYITLHENLVEKLRNKCRSFAETINPKQMDK